MDGKARGVDDANESFAEDGIMMGKVRLDSLESPLASAFALVLLSLLMSLLLRGLVRWWKEEQIGQERETIAQEKGRRRRRRTTGHR